jgi:hypothetical protein
MEQADVAHAIARLEAQGKQPSIQNIRKTLGRGSLRDITKYRTALLPPEREEASMDTTITHAAPAPTVVEEPRPPAPVPLLVQARSALTAALAAARTARRDWDCDRQNPVK